MYNATMFLSLIGSLIFLTYIVLYVNEQPFVILVESNKHRAADLVCFPTPGIRCEE